MGHSKVSSPLTCNRKYPDDPKREVFEAAKSGDAVLLSEVLQQMNSSERASALELTKMAVSIDHIGSSDTTKVTPLIMSVKYGNLDCVKVLLKYKADIEGRGDHRSNQIIVYQDSYRGFTPLFVAAIYGNLDVLSCLIENGADVNARSIDKDTPLTIASEKGDVNVVNFLIEHGANVELQSRYCRTALHHAVEHCHDSCDVLSCLVENGADVNAHTDDNCTPLMIASRNGDVNAITFLIEHGADVDLEDEYGRTALHHAVEHCHDSCDVLSCLVENGADVNVRTHTFNRTPLMIASRKGYVNVLTFLIEHGANVNLEDKYGETAFQHAVEHYHGSFDVLSCLVENGTDVNACTNDKGTLMIASRNGDVNVVTFLVEHGANIDLQDKGGKTALHHAVEHFHGPFDVLSCLLKYGANINACTNDKGTPLMIASRKGDVNVVTFLIEHGANVNLEDKYGKTALHCALEVHCHGSFGVLSCLLENGADVDLQDKDGKTALRYSVDCCCNSCNVLSCLLKNGADVNGRTNENRTPLMIASCQDNVNMVLFLVEHGADIDLQDKHGDTALHTAARCNSSKVVHRLLSLGTSQLYNNQGLTPLLTASKTCNISIVEDLITTLEVTKEQRIDALELLGASLVARTFNFFSIVKGFEYMKHGMEERFADPSHILLKQPMELVEAYQHRKESQTLEELAQIEGDTDAIIMEGLITRERILGTNNSELLDPIRYVADYFEDREDFPTCTGLRRYAFRVAQSCNESAHSDIFKETFSLFKKFWMNDPPREEDLLELLEQTVLEYEKQQYLRLECRTSSLFESTITLVQMIAKLKYYEEGKTSSVLLKRLCCLNPQYDYGGNTLLHQAVYYSFGPNYYEAPPFIDTVKLLLNAGFNVNAVNINGDTPLHTAFLFEPSNDVEIHLLSEMLEVLLDGGAHHDFVNNDGETAMDRAETDEARMILCEKRKLELKCISARAVKKFGLPYLGVVPKMLEKYISRH